MRAVARATAVLCAYSGAYWGAPSGTPNSLSASERAPVRTRGDFAMTDILIHTEDGITTLTFNRL
ncbi:hypothetical protein, partial [Tibeticola sp.]|uniref:hypothetical protein n=1 Tax=Tibeticola sp. TaxID=2005368 RepID=UPI002584419C